VASTTGGASYRDELRALSTGPAVVVGTPGRLLDHLSRKSIDASAVTAIVLDEADRMLDLGFRDELDAIFATLAGEHRTHLVSATFPADVRALADRVQRDAAHVEGTRLGTANTDIEHVIHLVHPREKLGALVNLLLESPEAQTLVFARTRADVAEITDELDRAGFRVGSLSGDLDQSARNRALGAFKRGDLQALVATDVAARGIDVQDISRVVHVDVPTNADSYTHRSGRTGRAGRRGTSALLVPPSALTQATRVLSRARVAHTLAPLPSAENIRRAADDRLFTELTTAGAPADAPADERVRALAQRLVEAGDVQRTLERLLVRTRGPERAEPRTLTDVTPKPKPNAGRRENERRGHPQGITTGVERAAPPRAQPDEGWVRFRVTWGYGNGADTRRLLAMVCRRGGIEGKSVGPIWVEKSFSVVGVAGDVAAAFAERASKPDPRDPRVRIEPYREPREPDGRRRDDRDAPRGHAPRRGDVAVPRRERGNGVRAREHGPVARERGPVPKERAAAAHGRKQGARPEGGFKGTRDKR